MYGSDFTSDPSDWGTRTEEREDENVGCVWTSGGCSVNESSGVPTRVRLHVINVYRICEVDLPIKGGLKTDGRVRVRGLRDTDRVTSWIVNVTM